MLIGNLTRDPELRYTPQGTAVCSFGLATNRSWLPSDSSERREETEFHRIVAWNKLAELCSQLLTKGRKVYVEGRLQTRSWETPDGEKRQTTEIVAEDMVLLDSRKPVGTEQTEEVEIEEKSEAKEEKKEEKVSDKKEKAPEETKETSGEEIDVDDIPF
ncbi:MAG: single-stranded DNA-binding protein [Patescibacteria group bacterium]|nr:single-stranded DNA-binding protein [Patescibacteria group bacterium]